jgi:RNA polymerase sigma factor (sigma-70 family)
MKRKAFPVENMDQLKTSPLHCDEHLVAAIRSGGPAGDKAIMVLYGKYRNKVMKSVRLMLHSHPGGKCEPPDIVHDAFIVMIDKIRSTNHNHSSLTGYWFGIAKFLYSNQQKKMQKVMLVEDDESHYGHEVINPESIFLNNERYTTMDRVLQSAGPRCRDLLVMWFNHYSMQEIAETLHLSSPGMARKIKHMCFKKLRILLKNRNVPVL